MISRWFHMNTYRPEERAAGAAAPLRTPGEPPTDCVGGALGLYGHRRNRMGRDRVEERTGCAARSFWIIPHCRSLLHCDFI